MLKPKMETILKVVGISIVVTSFTFFIYSPPFQLVSSKENIENNKNSNEVEYVNKENDYLKRNKIDVERVKRVCSKYDMHFSYPVVNSKKWPCSAYRCPIFVGGDYNFLCCSMAKVGLSSTKTILLQLLEIDVKANGSVFHARANRELERISPTLADKPAYKNHSKFITVRHPLERLLSAYLNKRHENTFNINFFNSVMMEHRHVENVTPDMVITFSEFIDYVLSVPTPRANIHWRAYWIYCGICEINYDYIIRMETMNDDLKVLYDRLGISKKVDIVWKNSHNSTDLTTQYFAELTKTQVKKLYDKFLFDFLLFDYSIEPYQSYAKDD